MTKRKMKAEPPDVIVTSRVPEPEEASEPKVALAPTVPIDVVKAMRPGTDTRVMDLEPIHKAAEAAGLAVSELLVCGGLIVRCGPFVPAFRGETVAEVVAKINTYQCKSCGTGGGHNPNCEKKP